MRIPHPTPPASFRLAATGLAVALLPAPARADDLGKLAGLFGIGFLLLAAVIGTIATFGVLAFVHARRAGAKAAEGAAGAAPRANKRGLAVGGIVVGALGCFVMLFGTPALYAFLTWDVYGNGLLKLVYFLLAALPLAAAIFTLVFSVKLLRRCPKDSRGGESDDPS